MRPNSLRQRFPQPFDVVWRLPLQLVALYMPWYLSFCCFLCVLLWEMFHERYFHVREGTFFAIWFISVDQHPKWIISLTPRRSATLRDASATLPRRREKARDVPRRFRDASATLVLFLGEVNHVAREICFSEKCLFEFRKTEFLPILLASYVFHCPTWLI